MLLIYHEPVLFGCHGSNGRRIQMTVVMFQRISTLASSGDNRAHLYLRISAGQIIRQWLAIEQLGDIGFIGRMSDSVCQQDLYSNVV